MSIRRVIVFVLAIAAIGVALWRLQGATDGLAVTRLKVGDIPVTLFRPLNSERAPVVVIAHGFAGSQQLMQPFAVTLARNGYVAVTYDQPGHGRNPDPLIGGIANDAKRNAALLDALDRVVRFARTLPQSDGRLALLGHSMASDIVIRYAENHPVDATVAVSVFSPSVTPNSPRDLLVIVGALEPQMLRDEALRIVGMQAGASPTPRVTYGKFDDGTARRVSFSGGVEHIGVLYSRQSMQEALAWFDAAFAHSGSGFVDQRGPLLGLLFLGLVALGWVLAGLLPRVASAPVGLAPRWPRFLLIAAIPAIATPLLTLKLPTEFLPILLGDYLAVHFAIYGVLTGLLILLFGRNRRDPRPPHVRVRAGALAVAVVLLAAYCVGAIGLPIDAYLTSFMPTSSRLPLIAAMFVGTLPYFVADEYLTRGARPPFGAYTFTKLFFIASLMIAVTLNLQRLFFLIIIVPVILIFFVIYGLLSTWTYRRTWHPLAGALANAFAFAWAIAVTFPVVASLE